MSAASLLIDDFFFPEYFGFVEFCFPYLLEIDGLCFVQCLRLFDVDGSELRLEAPSEAALLGCCFQDESIAFGVGSDGSVIR